MQTAAVVLGGLNTKAHDAVDKNGHLAEMHLSPRQHRDGPRGREPLTAFESGDTRQIVVDAADNSNSRRDQIPN